MGLDTESDQRAEGKPEGDGEKDVTNAGHGGGFQRMLLPMMYAVTLSSSSTSNV